MCLLAYYLGLPSHAHPFVFRGSNSELCYMSGVCLVNCCSVTIPYPLYVLLAISCLTNFQPFSFGVTTRPSLCQWGLSSFQAHSILNLPSIHPGTARLAAPALTIILSHRAHLHANPSCHVMVFIVLTFSCSTSFHCSDTDQ